MASDSSTTNGKENDNLDWTTPLDDQLRTKLQSLQLQDNANNDWSKIANAVIEALCTTKGKPTVSKYMEASAGAHDGIVGKRNNIAIAHQLWENLETLLQAFIDEMYLLAYGRDASSKSSKPSATIVDTYKIRYDQVTIFLTRILGKVEQAIVGHEDEWYHQEVYDEPLIGLQQLCDKVWNSRFPSQ